MEDIKNWAKVEVIRPTIEREVIFKKVQVKIAPKTQVEVIPRQSNRKTFALLFVIVVLLLGIGGYFAYGEWQSYKLNNDKQEIEIFQAGVHYGHSAALLEIFNEAGTCEPISLNNESTVITLIATQCLSMPK